MYVPRLSGEPHFWGQDPLSRLIRDVLNGGQVELIYDLCHPEYRDKDVWYGQQEGNLTSLKTFVQEMRSALPDLRFEPLFPIDSRENRIWGAFLASGTLTGNLYGQAPTGRHARWREIHMVMVDDGTGKIIQHIGAGDDLGMLAQLGIHPPRFI